MDTSNSTELTTEPKLTKKTITVDLEDFLSGNRFLEPTDLSAEEWMIQIKKCLKQLGPYIHHLPYAEVDNPKPFVQCKVWSDSFYKSDVPENPQYDKSDLGGATRLHPVANLFFRGNVPPREEEFEYVPLYKRSEHVEKYLWIREVSDDMSPWVIMERVLFIAHYTVVPMSDSIRYRVISEERLLEILADGRFGWKILSGFKELLVAAIHQKEFHLQRLNYALDQVWVPLSKFVGS